MRAAKFSYPQTLEKARNREGISQACRAGFLQLRLHLQCPIIESEHRRGTKCVAHHILFAQKA